MNLSDKEVLELTELCGAVVDGRITETQKARLSQWLATSAEAREFYVRALGLSASLYTYASEMQVEAPDLPKRAPNIITVAFRWGFGSLAAAAVVVFMLWFAERSKLSEATAAPKADEFVAQMTGTKNCRWGTNGASVRAGENLRKGQRLELLSGLAEITFDSGAQVVME